MDIPAGLEQQTADLSLHEGAPSFASEDSLASCSTYLQTSLQALGIKHTPDFSIGGANLAAICNSVYELLQKLQASEDAREQQAELVAKLRVDLQGANKATARLQAQLQHKEQANAELLIKQRQLDAWATETISQLGREKDAAEARCSQMAQRQVQAQYEARRREAEYERLQQKLRQQLTDRRRDGGRGAWGLAMAGGGAEELLQPQPAPAAAPTGPRGKRAPGRLDQEELHRRIVEAYETKKVELQQENASLRKALLNLQEAYKEVLNRQEQRSSPTDGDSGAADTATSGVRPPAAAPVPGYNGPGAAWREEGNMHGAAAARPERHDVGERPSTALSPAELQAALSSQVQALRHRCQSVLHASAASLEGPRPQVMHDDLDADGGGGGLLRERGLAQQLADAGAVCQEQQKVLGFALDVLAKSRPAAAPSEKPRRPNRWLDQRAT